MALPGGKPQNPPEGLLQRVRQWAGFGTLVTRLFLAGLGGWIRQRLNGTG
jgi:hypothetical protein